MVERDSAILDYPNEISSPLKADHHSVCKYVSRQDVNYISVRNVIKSLVEKFTVMSSPLGKRLSMDQHGVCNMAAMDELITRLGVAPKPTDTLDSLLDHYVPGSCDWILSDENFTSFMADDSIQPSILQVTGRPGSGKSTLASFLIQHLEEQDLSTHFWFFRHDDQLKRSTRQCLMSLAFQVMSSYPGYSHRLLSLAGDVDSIARSDVRSLWQKLFLNILNKLGSGECGPIYWVVDAVDESESAQVFLGLLGSLKGLHFPLRIIFFTRTHTVTKQIDRLNMSLPTGTVNQITVATPQASIELYISQELDYAPWPNDLKARITANLLEKSQGNFLWLSLVMKELVNCDTAEGLEHVLEETPGEIIDIYQRIEKAVARDLKSSDAKLVQFLLSWVTCSQRQMSEDDLKEALKPHFSIIHLRHTLSRLCGDFVIMDKRGNVAMVHYTAKEFLTKHATSVLAVNQGRAHTVIFSKCLSLLTDPRFRIRLKSDGCVGLIRHCCLSWYHHMDRSDDTGCSIEYIQKLAVFFQSTACLAWIEAVAATGQVVVLTSTAKALAAYLKRVHRIFSEVNLLKQPLVAIELLGLWSSELVRIVGKFASHLLQHPSCIHSLVPVFCPPDSAISRQFSAASSIRMRVTGLSNRGWDDSLAKFDVGRGHRAKAIYCLDSSFGILTSDKSVVLYSAATFQVLRKFQHNENVVLAHFNQDGTMLITCGIKTVKVWDTLSTRPLYTYRNPQGMRAMAASFSEDCSEIILCCIDSNLRRQLLSDPENWLHVSLHSSSYNSPGVIHGVGGGAPICTAFSPDGSKVVMAFRTAPAAIWGTESGNLIGRLNNKHSSHNVDYPVRLTWNPATDHVIGIFNTGTIFKWYPLDRDYTKMEANAPVMATEIACSPDGRLIVTSQRDGSLKIFSFDNFTLLYNLTGMSRATAVAVSPDGRRVYDIRQAFCNVWEPNTLIRMAEQDEIDRASDTASSQFDLSSDIFSVVSEASAVNLEPVSAICAATTNNTFAFGNDAGVVTIMPHGSHTQMEDVRVPCGLLGITCLAISGDGCFVATASMDRKLTVRRVTQAGVAKIDVLIEARSKHTISDMLFDIDSQHLVVICQETVQIWSMATGVLMSARPNTTEGHSRWMAHPSKQRGFLSIGPRSIIVHDIQDPSVQLLRGIDTSEGGHLTDRIGLLNLTDHSAGNILVTEHGEATVDKVFHAPGERHILLQTSKVEPMTGGRRTVQYLLMSSEHLEFVPPPHETEEIESIPARPLPSRIRSIMEIPLGFLVDNTNVRRVSTDTISTQGVRAMDIGQRHVFAFIDRDFWVRTWNPHDVEGAVSRKHFFLPRDWVNMECLELAQVTVDGRFMCPRNGEVALIHNGFEGPGWTE